MHSESTLSSADQSSGGRVLAIDAGERRVGVAMSDQTRLLASPVMILDRSVGGLAPVLDRLVELVQREGVRHVLVGLPLNADGSEGRQARRARDFARVAERVLQVPVTMWDERLSTRQADAIVRAQGGKRRTATDDVAAAVILQDYLNAQC